MNIKHPCQHRFKPNSRCRMLRPALAYAAKGMPVFPCKVNKHPYTKNGFHDATTDRKTLVKWWGYWPDANIGLPTGADSKCFVLDVDEGDGKHGEAALSALMARHGLLPETHETRTPRGGRHLYFSHPGRKIKNRQDHPATDLDIRGDGGYVLVPPSKTKQGEYVYIQERPLAECPFWLLDMLDEGVTEQVEQTEHMASIGSDLSSLSVTLPLTLDDVLSMALPKKNGQRNRRLLVLARGLKFNLDKADTPLSELKPIVRRWYEMAKSVISTKSFLESWADFVHAWPRARHPLGYDVLSDAWRRANSEPAPAAAAEYEDDEKIRLLVCLCWALASSNPSRRFFLSTYKAGPLLGVSTMTVSRWLAMLVADTVLELIERGKHGMGGHASRFRWTAKEGAMP